jgi:hypothetical protein
MLPELLGLLVLLAGGPAETRQGDATLQALSQELATLRRATLPAFPGKAAFRPAERAVTNWRIQATAGLDLPPESTAKLRAGLDPAGVTRCVRLNNYWCVKRAGWAGEIAADAEGHVAFASAVEGAIVAAMLLRRYYLVYHRVSAQAILSRWAPAQCGLQAAGIARSRSARRRTEPKGHGALALRGIGNTLRARWLAAHRRGSPGGGKIAPPRRSVVADRPVALMRAPEIAIGMGELDLGRAPVRIAALDLAEPPAPRSGSAGGGAGAACPHETRRLRNYAMRAIEGIAASPTEDLKLFSLDGTPGPNLPRLMQNMAKVEIGPLGPRAELIAAAVDLERRRNLAAAAFAGTPPAAQ